jgi:hypothetical protein
MTNLEDLEAAMKTAKAMGQSKIPVHLFVLADLLAKAREAVEMSDFERDAKHFMRSRR